MKIHAAIVLLCTLSGHAAETGISRQPLGKTGAAGKTLFTEVPRESTGVEFVNRLDVSDPRKYLYASAMSTGGVAVGDVNGDGRPDIFLTSGPGENQLFLQTGDWKWQAAGTPQTAGGTAWATGCAMADADNDGDLDIYVCNYLTPNELLINDALGKFTPKAAGVEFADASHTPSFVDYDHDGDLDLYVLTNRWYRPEGFPDEQTIEVGPNGPRVLPKWEKYYDAVEVAPGKFATNVVGRPDILARNKGDGTYEVVTEQAGIRHRGHGLSASWFDWNGDGWADLWVGNDFDDPDRLYRNNRNGTFTDVTKETIMVSTWFSMGADSGDLNGDALPDFFIADMAGSSHFKQKTAMGSMGDKQFLMEFSNPNQLMRNCLFVNAGNGRFFEAGNLAGLAKTNWTWAVRLADLDNDGRNDVYVQCGMSRNFNEKDDPEALRIDPGKTQWDRYAHLPPMKEPSLAYRNDGDLVFKEVSKDWGLNHNGMSYGCAMADLDRDGDLDVISIRLDEPVALLRNDSAGGNRALFRFKGRKSNRNGLGVQLKIRTESGTLVRELAPVRGYMGCDEPLLHAGLGEAKIMTAVEVRWPSGIFQKLENLPAGFLYTVEEPESGAPAPVTPPEVPVYAASKALERCVHRELPFDDFKFEPLLPNRMSQNGPGQAWGDIDGDGDDDLFLSAGKDSPAQLCINDGGTLTPRVDATFAGDLLVESMGALFFDADADGDQDLFIVSGGVESNPGAPVYQDLLYLNDGKGAFRRAPDGTIPEERDSGGAVAAADFDRDGDLDLFVGGRSVPGAWPVAARSHLLRNEGGKFTAVTDKLAPELAAPGMVTGAGWTDADADGWPDLLIVQEFGPPALFRNAAGKLALDQKSGLAKLSGWWQGVAVADFDGDGDMDAALSNAGLNTKYHASEARPAVVFYGDLDGSGQKHICEAEYEGDTLFPVRGKSCSSQAMPFIREKFSTYRSFAAASVQEIYGSRLSKVSRHEAVQLRSGILWNDGKGIYEFSPLPWLAQTAPGFGIAAPDANADGRPDLVLAQNFAHPQVETGKMLTGLSVLLLNSGDRKFTALMPPASGISVAADARSLAIPDLNRDGTPDLAFTINAGAMQGLVAQKQNSFCLTLTGKPGNPLAVGARVRVELPGLPVQTADLCAGNSYLTAGPACLYFAGKEAQSGKCRVTWPDGTATDHIITVSGGNVSIAR